MARMICRLPFQSAVVERLSASQRMQHPSRLYQQLSCLHHTPQARPTSLSLIPSHKLYPRFIQHARPYLLIPHASASNTATPKKYDLRPLTKDDVDIQFSRSGGAGGQNVNKVNTKVDMRFALDKADWVPDEVKDAIKRAEKNRFNKEGLLIVTSTRHRTQAQNLDDALVKLQEMIDAAVVAVTPKEVDPEVAKRVKNAIKAGNERRLDNKKKDSMRKQERRSKNFD